MYTACQTHSPTFDNSNNIWEGFKLWSQPLRGFLQSLVSSSSSGRNNRPAFLQLDQRSVFCGLFCCFIPFTPIQLSHLVTHGKELTARNLLLDFTRYFSWQQSFRPTDQIMVFWVLAPCRITCCLHLQDDWNWVRYVLKWLKLHSKCARVVANHSQGI